MSRFSGPQHRGAQREARATRAEAADERNARTPVERAARYRRGEADGEVLLRELFKCTDKASA